MNGFLIAVCGIDGSGKSTLLAGLAEHLGEHAPVVTTRQPTDLYRTDAAVRALLNMDAEPTQVLLRELALFSAFDRSRHMREVVEPAIRQGAIVLTDRYVYSAYAYFLARGLDDIDWLTALNVAARPPALTLYLDLDPAVAVERIISRDGHSRKREEINLTRMTLVREHFVNQPWGVSQDYVMLDSSAPPERILGEALKHALSRAEAATAS